MNAESVPVGREGAQVEVSERPCWYAGTAAAIGVFVAVFVAIGLAAVCIVFAVIEALPVLVAPAVILVVAAGVGLSMVVIRARPYVRGAALRPIRGHGAAIRNGLVPPLTTHRRVSARVRNFETAELKVNDAVGNPVHVAAIIVWQVADTAKATFGVEDYEEFIGTQAESALRQVTTAHPYDDDASHGTTSLRGSTDQVAAELAEQVADRASLRVWDPKRASPRSPTPRRSPRRCSSGSRPRPCWRAREDRRRRRRTGPERTGQTPRPRAWWPRRRAPCGNGVQPAGGAVR